MYKLYQSSLIEKKHEEFLKDANIGLKKLALTFPNDDKTHSFYKYNFFTVTSGSEVFYDLFNDLKWCIRDFTQHKGRLWMYCWINEHDDNELLDWHYHDAPWHGYISIDPKETVTEFKEYQINNKIGQIYIGYGHKSHRVISNDKFTSKRITLGFDVHDSTPLQNSDNQYSGMLSFIPI
jgi:hypothetical protein